MRENMANVANAQGLASAGREGDGWWLVEGDAGTGWEWQQHQQQQQQQHQQPTTTTNNPQPTTTAATAAPKPVTTPSDLRSPNNHSTRKQQSLKYRHRSDRARVNAHVSHRQQLCVEAVKVKTIATDGRRLRNPVRADDWRKVLPEFGCHKEFRRHSGLGPSDRHTHGETNRKTCKGKEGGGDQQTTNTCRSKRKEVTRNMDPPCSRSEPAAFADWHGSAQPGPPRRPRSQASQRQQQGHRLRGLGLWDGYRRNHSE